MFQLHELPTALIICGDLCSSGFMIASQKFAATPVSYRAIRVSEAEPVSSWVKEIDSGLENMTELNALCIVSKFASGFFLRSKKI